MITSSGRLSRRGIGPEAWGDVSGSGSQVSTKIVKVIAGAFGEVLATPYTTADRLLRPLVGSDHAWATATEAIAKIPGVFGVYARQAFYRRRLKHVGRSVHFGFMSTVSKRQAIIGDRVHIGRFCSIGMAELGDEVLLADGVQILSGRHQHGAHVAAGTSWHQNKHQFTKVSIGSGAWLGTGAIVMANVGTHAVVGAGAVVVHPVGSGAKVGGVPAVPLIRKAA